MFTEIMREDVADAASLGKNPTSRKICKLQQGDRAQQKVKPHAIHHPPLQGHSAFHE
jgi:hypothetical protein